MKDKIVNLIPYFLFIIIFVSIIIFSDLNNTNCFTIVYVALSLYLIFNLFKKKDLNYKRYFYIFWIILTILLNIFLFSVVNIIVSVVIFGIIALQLFLNKKCKKEPKKEEEKTKKFEINVELPKNFDVEKFEENTRKIYIDMQTYFMNLDYDNLRKILNETMYDQFSSQMQHLEKTNKRAMRENIDIFDFKINEYEKINNKVTIKVSVGVYEDKYTKYLDNKTNPRIISYESYYELTLEKMDNWVISNLKLLYSHSKKN